MNKEQFTSAIEKSKELSSKKNFRQTFDLIINLKGIDLKKPEHQVDVFVTLPHSKGKKAKVCALIGPELQNQAKDVVDNVILYDNFDKFREKKDIKKVANEYDYFIGQGNIMPKIATVFGKVFGPRGKMPNPKSGCIVPPNTSNLKPLYEKLQRTVRAKIRGAPIIQCPIGTEDMSTVEVADNAMTVLNAVLQALPNEKHNIKGIYVKLTMSSPVKVGEKLEEEIKVKK